MLLDHLPQHECPHHQAADEHVVFRLMVKWLTQTMNALAWSKMKNRAQIERMQNLDNQTWLKKCGQLGCQSRSKLSLTNSEIQVKSRIRESVLVFGGEIPLETWKLGSKFSKFFAVYTPP